MKSHCPLWALPPKAKIYEALTAVADGRVRQTGPTEAEVVSSGRDRTYRVCWSPDGRRFSSDDNASYWQGYMGYPIVAVLMVLGHVPYQAAMASTLAGLPWHEINRQFRRDYDRAVHAVLEELQARGYPWETVVREVDQIYEALRKLALERGPRPPRPAQA